ncbi:MAG TPA: hypothetical protein VGQ39_12690 [Pyrinomonadaceae bacterium]|jgi:hypothetical protein|nr:hypothetical protein [Pyrinomonadaceae bacterium]
MLLLSQGQPQIDSLLHSALVRDYESFRSGLPHALEEYVQQQYRIDLSSEYGGLRIKNPFGKASGQLSLNISQVRRDCEDGLGFVVLKSIIAEDANGAQSMSEWAIEETRMIVERIVGADGTEGWTVSWKGRGWYDTFEKYLEFFDEALSVAKPVDVVVAPSCKYHLPGAAEEEWKIGEYEYTTRRLLEVWQRHHADRVMPIEKDFSPTLAGSDRAAQAEMIIQWLTRVTGLMRRAALPLPINIGLKVFNAILDDDFQLEMLRAINERCAGEDAPDFLVYGNRLFDPNREFDGVRGIAYGGPDLSVRNLSVLAHMRLLENLGTIPVCRLPISGTGNIVSGRMAAEYLLRGASSFQIHTYFQLPSGEYSMQTGGKTARALLELYFHPQDGLLAWLLHLRRMFDWPVEWNLKRMAEFCLDPANKVWATHEPALS